MCVRASMREVVWLWLCECVFMCVRGAAGCICFCRSLFEFFNEGLSGRRFGDEIAEELKRHISDSAHL